MKGLKEETEISAKEQTYECGARSGQGQWKPDVS